MTEPWVASSDPTNIAGRIRADGDHYVIDAHKWWTTGAASSRCRFTILMGVTDAEADTHHRHSMVIVPLDAPGVTNVRSLPVLGHDEGGGHCELLFEGVRVPKENLLGREGDGFALAQARLGPGRIHHCMRAIGMAELALELMCARAQQRVAFGTHLADQGVIQTWIAESRIEIEQARLLTMRAAWLMDTVGVKGARFEISAIKVVAARLAGTRHRPRDPGVRCRRPLRRLAARRHVPAGAHAPIRRRSRRGAPPVDRPSRAAPLRGVPRVRVRVGLGAGTSPVVVRDER